MKVSKLGVWPLSWSATYAGVDALEPPVAARLKAVKARGQALVLEVEDGARRWTAGLDLGTQEKAERVALLLQPHLGARLDELGDREIEVVEQGVPPFERPRRGERGSW